MYTAAERFDVSGSGTYVIPRRNEKQQPKKCPFIPRMRLLFFFQSLEADWRRSQQSQELSDDEAADVDGKQRSTLSHR
jgi:hypothetical protein